MAVRGWHTRRASGGHIQELSQGEAGYLAVRNLDPFKKDV